MSLLDDPGIPGEYDSAKYFGRTWRVMKTAACVIFAFGDVMLGLLPTGFSWPPSFAGSGRWRRFGTGE